VDKRSQLPYTECMKKVTMKDFRWVGKPQRWVKTYKELSLTVGPMLCLPEGPLMLAVSDEDFTLSLTTTTAPDGGFCGVCLYHTQDSYTAVGISKTSLLVESSVRSYKTTTQIPLPTGEDSIQWMLERKGSLVRMGYALPPEEDVEWVSSTAIPGMESSVSFGVFFSNHTQTPFEADMHSLRYVKNESQEPQPLV
jgi:regulation of enolase protein 1 (concanavalin A-like superfamily)